MRQPYLTTESLEVAGLEIRVERLPGMFKCLLGSILNEVRREGEGRRGRGGEIKTKRNRGSSQQQRKQWVNN